jgi:hypothetical protein
MLRFVLTMLLAVPLPAPFGDAEASALTIDDDGSAVLEVSVEIQGAPVAVLVRGIGLVDELPPIALVPRGDGTYGGLVELNTTIGVLLGFEYIPAGGGAAVVSDLHTLIELGVDQAALARVQPGEVPSISRPTVSAEPESAPERRWGWLALAAGAAGLALVFLWLWLGRDDGIDNWSGNTDNSADADEETSGEPADGPG